MKLRKVLLIILGIIALISIGMGIWSLTDRVFVTQEQKTIRNTNVRTLNNDSEKKIGTIIYAGAKKDSEVKTEGQNQVLMLSATDSVDGAFNIYYQDILNRYKTYDVTKKGISKDDALDKSARVIVCTGQSGSITVTIWANRNGMTQIEIATTTNFK